MVGEFFIFVAIFVGIMAISALIFGTWFIVMVFRGVAGFLGLRGEPHADVKGPRHMSGAVQTGPVASKRACPFELCKASNDGNARFCRRCGRELSSPAHVDVRRAAVL